MKKLKFIPVFVLILTMFFCVTTVFATIYYKDIASVSIKLNFNQEYSNIIENGMPEINYGEDSSCNVYTMNTKYEIESCDWYDSNTERDFVIGGMPKVVIYLVTKDYPYQNNTDKEYYYRFVSGYSQSTCMITGGEFVSAQRMSISSLKVVARIKGIKGTYGQPNDVRWVDEWGNLQWEPATESGDSGYYDIALYKNDKKVTEIAAYHGNSYNLRPYMTSEGDYEARVRTVPGNDNQRAYGKKSEYSYSGSTYVTAENVYTGGADMQMMQNNATGWVNNNGSWFYKEPNGDYARAKWVKTNNKWYYLGADGVMLTGWFTNAYNKTFYLASTTGAMVTGWMQDGDNYHFFNTNQDASEGVMLKEKWLQYEGKWYYFDGNGNMLTGWQQIPDKYGITHYYYFYPKGSMSGLYGYLATNTNINGFNVNANGEWVQ